MLTDTHCHLYLPDFAPDLRDLITRAEKKGITRIFLPAIDSKTHESLIQLCVNENNLDHPKTLFYPMMGLHPCSVKENFEEELRIAEQHLNGSTTFYAVGEIGLDFYWDVSFKKQQFVAFERQIEWAISKSLPIVIHSRNSTQECIDVVRQYQGKVKGIFHCFGGTLQEANQIIDLGFYLGIGGVVTYKNSGLKEVLRNLSIDNIVLETDAPYLTPVPYRGKRNEPSYLELICENVATAMNKTPEEIAHFTSQNAAKAFQLI